MRSKIPTLLAIFILIISVIATSYGINQIRNLTSHANSNYSPQEVKITNITDSSFSVSWLTDTPTIGFVEYGSKLSIPTINSQTHLITLTNLIPTTLYSFKINSNGNTFGPWSVQTKNISQTHTNFISGKILTPNNLPAKYTIVYVNAAGETYSSLTSESGNWIVNIPQLPESNLIEIVAENGKFKASAITNITNTVPEITLGKSYDFRNVETKNASDTPQVPITLP